MLEISWSSFQIKKRNSRRYGIIDHSYPYIASLTRVLFLFYEMRSTAKLMAEGNSDDALEDDSLVSAIASQPTDVAKQICLYALMKQSRSVLRL